VRENSEEFLGVESENAYLDGLDPIAKDDAHSGDPNIVGNKLRWKLQQICYMASLIVHTWDVLHTRSQYTWPRVEIPYQRHCKLSRLLRSEFLHHSTNHTPTTARNLGSVVQSRKLFISVGTDSHTWNLMFEFVDEAPWDTSKMALDLRVISAAPSPSSLEPSSLEPLLDASVEALVITTGCWKLRHTQYRSHWNDGFGATDRVSCIDDLS
jgi:hypothetical protein